MKNNILLRILLILAIYLGLKYFGGEYGRIILYPFTLLVTFLHEFGHALGALITGGSVEGITINPNGSGLTTSRGGSLSVILMGGYLGSAILGNLLFYIGARKSKWSGITLNIMAVLMIITGLYWFDTLYTTLFLGLFAIALFFIANKTNFDREVLMFMGLASILYIIQDFNVGPSSDLQKYAEIFVVVPVSVWMYLWLAIAVILFIWNIRMIFRGGIHDEGSIDDRALDDLA